MPIKIPHCNNNQADVTLVLDDKVAFSAHKFILGALRPILKDLLIHNPHPLNYLKGVKELQLTSIPEFI